MTTKTCNNALVAALLCTAAIPANAQETTDWLAKERFQLRARTIAISADGDGTVDGTNLGTDVGNAVVPEIDLTYFITDNIAAELIAATAQHRVSANSGHIGDVWILPPTLTLQYHFTPDAKFSPYVGAGLNYTFFYGEDDGAGFNDLDVKGGAGYALQAGFDYWINDNWGFNIDAKYIDLEIDAKVKAGSTQLRASNLDLNPWIFGAGLSYRF